jgi:hypothetical protein
MYQLLAQSRSTRLIQRANALVAARSQDSLPSHLDDRKKLYASSVKKNDKTELHFAMFGVRVERIEEKFFVNVFTEICTGYFFVNNLLTQFKNNRF